MIIEALFLSLSLSPDVLQNYMLASASLSCFANWYPNQASVDLLT